VQIFEIDPGGTVTQLQDLVDSSQPGGAYTPQGTPPQVVSFGISGAGHWATSFFAYAPNVASSTLPTVLNAGLVGVSALIDGDAAGNTFVVLNESIPANNVIEELDGTGTLVWRQPPPPMSPNAPAAQWQALAADGLGGVYGIGDVIFPLFDFGCGPTSGQYITRFDASGKCAWSQAYPSGLGFNTAELLAAPTEEVYVVATFQGTVDAFGCGPVTSASGTSSLVAKLDTSGACLWSRSFATASLDVRVFPGSGDLLLSTNYAGTIDLGGGPITSVGKQDLAVGHLSAAGTLLWSRSFGGPGATVSWSDASADALGGVAEVVGVTGTVDFGGGPFNGNGVLFKLGSSGAFRWQLAPYSGVIASDPSGAVLASDDTHGTVMKLAP